MQDENGQKMSKSKGNAVDPFEALANLRRGRHPLVFLHQLRALAAQTLFTAKAVLEGQRKFMGTLWNTYAFFVLYANIDANSTLRNIRWNTTRLSVMDKWMLVQNEHAW